VANTARKHQYAAMKNGWKTAKLGDVCDFEGGSQPPKSQFAHEQKPGYVRFLQIRDFGSDKNITFIPQSKKNRQCIESDILIGRYGASVGKILTNKTGAYNVALMKTVPNLEVLNQSWFYNYLISDEFQGHLLKVADRSAQAGFSKDDIYNFPVPMPPLPEQRRIVGILDEAFQGIVTAKANAEKNLQNARAVFESHLQFVFTQRGARWGRRRLGEIAEVQSGGTPSVPQKSYWGGDIPWYSSGELNETYTIQPVRQITEAGLNNSNAKLFPKGSLLVGMYDTAALKMSILDRDATFNQAIAGVKSNDKIVAEFVLHAINANKPRLLLERRGVRQKNLSLGKIKEIEIPLPDITEQRAVVSLLHNVMGETQRLESIYQQKLAALEELKKSLLSQAFAGKL
jgi:type I restriction enzyme S subunit